MDQRYLDSIKNFEGYTPRAQWDYKQHSVGYGTRARYPGETISRDEAERRFQSEIGNARSIVERIAPNAPEGVKAALTSLTYNAGSDWENAGLGQAVRSGNYDEAQRRFLQYVNADGEPLPGLVSRRQAESKWFNDATPASSVPPVLQSGYGRQSGPGYSAPTGAVASAKGEPSTLKSAFAGFTEKPLGKMPDFLGGGDVTLKGIGGSIAGAAGAFSKQDSGSDDVVRATSQANAQALAEEEQRQASALQSIMRRRRGAFA